jgi:hypothetical protein
MPDRQTADEIREQHLRDMGSDLGAVYNVLTNDVTWLHAKWEQYRALFAKSERRIDLLNETAGYLFRLIQDTLFEDVVLGLARLTDPIQTGRGAKQQENLTLQRLPTLVPDPALSSEVTALATAALAACAAPRSWRNKRLAHRDLAVALATAGDPLPGISRADVEAALMAFRALLNRLERHYWDSEVYYQTVLTNLGTAENLVHYLQRGLKAERAWRERLSSGALLPEDIAPEEKV